MGLESRMRLAVRGFTSGRFGNIKRKIAGLAVSGCSISELMDARETALLSSPRTSFQCYLAALPKSGGTTIAHVLAEYFNAQYVHVGDRNGACEFDVYRPSMIDLLSRAIVIHQHTPATQGNIEYIRDYGLKTIVLVRNIFDVVVSLRDHMVHESTRWPVFSAPPDFVSLSERRQYDYIIAHAIPWMVHFYVSWYLASVKRREIEVIWIRYEDFVEKKIEFFAKLVAWLDAGPVEHARVDAAIRLNGSKRFNVGVPGRGRCCLSSVQQTRIAELFEFYRGVDFRPIGLS